MPQTLADVPVSHKAVIVEFSREDTPVKLLEMGLLPGNEVLVKGQAAFNGAIHIEVGGYSLALRLDEAEHVNVEHIESIDQAVL